MPGKGKWVRVATEDVQLTDVGTAACAEAFFDRGVYLGIRVFLGAACGPRG
jgi:hypothetical protein